MEVFAPDSLRYPISANQGLKDFDGSVKDDPAVNVRSTVPLFFDSMVGRTSLGSHYTHDHSIS
ncbi:MAG: hypothetical protein GWP41_02670 [Planctomycetia bacterium]|nr:hypothetical protein [Planctomycetia bacterium]